MKKNTIKSLDQLNSKQLNSKELTQLKGGTTDTTDNIGTQDVVDL